ncbi:MAG: TolC family protein [Planctomycetota bacterium]|nr:MAG: TolC family protein [Planctomycetota bacterium]
MQISIHRFTLAGSAALVLLAGCAKVNPAPDYRRAAEYASRATGQARLFDPQQRDSDEQAIKAMLADGLSADEAVQIALLNQPQLQAALFEIGAARADLVQAGLLSNPNLGIALRLPSAGGLANIDFDLAQNIADLWQIPVRKRMAQRNLEQTILQIARQAAETAAQAKEAFYRAGGAERQLEIARENLDVGRTIVELTKLRRQAGAGSELDVNLARGVLLDAELAVKRAQLAAGSARRALATVLGLSIDASRIRLIQAAPSPPAHMFDAAALADLAFSERLDVRALRQSVAAADERLLLERRRVFPELSVGLAFERGERPRGQGRDILADTARASIAAGQLTAPEIQPRSARDVDTDLIIGPALSLELPIFDQNQAQIAKAQFELEQRLRLLDGLERTIRQEVREAAAQAQTAWELARFYREQVVPQAERNLQMSRDSYRAGKSAVLSVLDAERTFLAARQRQAEALEQAAAVIPQLERTVGLPLTQMLQRLRGEQGSATSQPTARRTVAGEGQ